MGAIYLTQLPSVFIVAHADYVRVVRLRPLGPSKPSCASSTCSPRVLANGFDMRNVVDFTNT